MYSQVIVIDYLGPVIAPTLVYRVTDLQYRYLDKWNCIVDLFIDSFTFVLWFIIMQLGWHMNVWALISSVVPFYWVAVNNASPTTNKGAVWKNGVEIPRGW